MSGDHPHRKPLPTTRNGRRVKIEVYTNEGDVDLYLLMNFYEDTGSLGEIFVNVSKQGSTLQGMLDGWAIMVSVALQHGVPLYNIIDKFAGQSFPPAGPTSYKEVPSCTSLLDLIVRVLQVECIKP